MAQRDWNDAVNRFGPALLLFARQYVPNVQDAEGVMHDAILRLWRKEMGNIEDNELKKLLYVCVRNAALDFLRSETRRKKREQTYWNEKVGSVSMFQSNLERDEMRKELEKAMAELPEEQKMVLTMKIWSELTFREIAEILNISIGTAASRHRLGIEALRKKLSNEVMS